MTVIGQQIGFYFAMGFIAALFPIIILTVHQGFRGYDGPDGLTPRQSLLVVLGVLVGWPLIIAGFMVYAVYQLWHEV